MESHLRSVRRTLKPGWEVLNWKSLSVADYINQADESLNQFSAVYSVLEKTKEDIEDRLKEIFEAELFPELPPRQLKFQPATGTLYTCKVSSVGKFGMPTVRFTWILLPLFDNPTIYGSLFNFFFKLDTNFRMQLTKY